MSSHIHSLIQALTPSKNIHFLVAARHAHDAEQFLSQHLYPNFSLNNMKTWTVHRDYIHSKLDVMVPGSEEPWSYFLFHFKENAHVADKRELISVKGPYRAIPRDVSIQEVLIHPKIAHLLDGEYAQASQAKLLTSWEQSELTPEYESKDEEHLPSSSIPKPKKTRF